MSLEEGPSVGGVEVEGGGQWEKYNNIVSPCQDGKKGIRLIVRYKARLPEVNGMVVNCKTKALKYTHVQSRIIHNSQLSEAVQVFIDG